MAVSGPPARKRGRGTKETLSQDVGVTSLRKLVEPRAQLRAAPSLVHEHPSGYKPTGYHDGNPKKGVKAIKRA